VAWPLSHRPAPVPLFRDRVCARGVRITVTDTASVILASAGLMIGGPISAATGGYLYAIGDAATPLRVTSRTRVWLLIARDATGGGRMIGWVGHSSMRSCSDAVPSARRGADRGAARVPAVGAWLGPRPLGPPSEFAIDRGGNRGSGDR
jgi:hypothetical protein